MKRNKKCHICHANNYSKLLPKLFFHEKSLNKEDYYSRMKNYHFNFMKLLNYKKRKDNGREEGLK